MFFDVMAGIGIVVTFLITARLTWSLIVEPAWYSIVATWMHCRRAQWKPGVTLLRKVRVILHHAVCRWRSRIWGVDKHVSKLEIGGLVFEPPFIIRRYFRHECQPKEGK